MNNFLKTGQKCENDSGSSNEETSSENSSGDDHDNGKCEAKSNEEEKQLSDNVESSASSEIKMITANPKIPIDMNDVLELIEQIEGVQEHSTIEVDSKGDSRNMTAVKTITTTNDDIERRNVSNDSSIKGVDSTKPVLKAKALRQLRKAEKLAAKGISNEAEVVAVKKTPKNMEKTLTSFINEMPTDGKYQIKVCHT